MTLSFRFIKSFVVLIAVVMAAGACRREEATTAGGSSGKKNPPIVIISIDTLRADHLPAYGYSGVETPNIDRLRKDSILYANAYTHVPLTLPSHVSLLTGHLPATTGVRNNLGYAFDASARPTLPGLLKQNGYATGAAVSAVVLRGTTGLSDAFDFYDDKVAVVGGGAAGSSQRAGDDTAAVASKWIASRRKDPFFFMLHIFEPHTPYTPAPEFQNRYASSPYDGEIATSDRIVGTFLENLKSSGVYEEALIILLSDHGEGLNQHGEEEHGIFLYREALRVPLLVKLPGNTRGGAKIDVPVQLTDVMPTVLEVAGVTVPKGLHGISLLKAERTPPRSIYSETMYPRIHLGWSDLHSLIGEQYHFIDAPKPELYDFRSDPAEKVNVLADQRRVYARLREEMSQYDRSLNMPSAVDSETAKQLASLGYLGQTSANTAGSVPDPKDHIADIRLMREITQRVTRGDYDRAIEGYKQVLERNPRFTDAWSHLARTYEEAGRYEEAAAAYRKNLELAPSLAGELGLSLGLVYLNLRQYDDAVAHAKLAVDTNPAGAHLLLARIAHAKKDYPETLRQARMALEFPSYRAAAMVLIAQGLVGQGKLEEALMTVDEARREAAATGAKVAFLEFVRGDVLARMNRVAEAEQAFLTEIRNFPKDRQPYANLAVIYLLQGRVGDAEKTMESLVRANPSRASFELAATTFEELGRPDLARSWKKRAKR